MSYRPIQVFVCILVGIGMFAADGSIRIDRREPRELEYSAVRITNIATKKVYKLPAVLPPGAYLIEVIGGNDVIYQEIEFIHHESPRSRELEDLESGIVHASIVGIPQVRIPCGGILVIFEAALRLHGASFITEDEDANEVPRDLMRESLHGAPLCATSTADTIKVWEQIAVRYKLPEIHVILIDSDPTSIIKWLRKGNIPFGFSPDGGLFAIVSASYSGYGELDIREGDSWDRLRHPVRLHQLWVMTADSSSRETPVEALTATDRREDELPPGDISIVTTKYKKELNLITADFFAERKKLRIITLATGKKDISLNSFVSGEVTFYSLDQVQKLIAETNSRLVIALDGMKLSAMSDYIQARLPNPRDIHPSVRHADLIEASSAQKHFDALEASIRTASLAADDFSLDFEVSSSPRQASFSLSTVKKPGLYSALTDHTFFNLYRGEYTYTVSRDGYKVGTGPANLVDDPRMHLSCTLVQLGSAGISKCDFF
jgi:hypothetical protein